MFDKETKKIKTCCFIECRTQISPLILNTENIDNITFSKKLKEVITNLIETNNVTHYISGLSLGAEQCAAEIVLELKLQYSQVTLECAIPYETQAENWTEAERNKYFLILKNCDKETLLQFHCSNNCIQKRNKYMSQSSNYVIFINIEESTIQFLNRPII